MGVAASFRKKKRAARRDRVTGSSKKNAKLRVSKKNKKSGGTITYLIFILLPDAEASNGNAATQDNRSVRQRNKTLTGQFVRELWSKVETVSEKYKVIKHLAEFGTFLGFTLYTLYSWLF